VKSRARPRDRHNPESVDASLRRVRGKVYAATDTEPLIVPEGSRRGSGFARIAARRREDWGISLYTPVSSSTATPNDTDSAGRFVR